MTLFVCPKLEEGENWQDTSWIPVLARIIIMPNNIGAEKTDNGHAEAMGMALAEETLPTSLPYILLTDSNALQPTDAQGMASSHPLDSLSETSYQAQAKVALEESSRTKPYGVQNPCLSFGTRPLSTINLANLKNTSNTLVEWMNSYTISRQKHQERKATPQI